VGATSHIKELIYSNEINSVLIFVPIINEKLFQVTGCFILVLLF